MSRGTSAAPDVALPAELARGLHHRVAELQVKRRFPAVSAAVARRGELAFSTSVGDPAPAADVQFRIGSITKTFTAVLVLALRDAGALRLDDRLDAHVPGAPFGDRTVRDCLGHLSGMTREPPGDFWEASPGLPADELLGGLRSAEAVLPARRAYHYSNLAFGLLGHLVERLRGARFDEVLDRELLRPLELRRTTYLPVPPHATGFRVHPHADELRAEPMHDTGAMAPAGQLWSTPADLVRWGSFLAEPDPAVLAADTLEEMCEPVSMRDADGWTRGYGLGLELYRRGDRVLAGHGGSMPGFMAGLAVARREKVTAALCGNAWFAGDLPGLSVDIAVQVLDEDPLPPEPWRPDPPEQTPDGVLELVGTWYYRGAAMLALWRGDALWLTAAEDPTGADAESFSRVGPDVFRGTSGGDRGETLRVLRAEDGRPVLLEVASWRLARDPDDPSGGP